jgi:hypothetical protein
MAAVVLLMRSALPMGWPVAVKLAADLAVAVSTYGLALVLFHRTELRNLLRIAKPA